jgi:hypothetical protein
MGGWVGPRAGLDAMEKRKFLILLGLELQPLGHPTCSQSLYRLHYPGSGTVLVEGKISVPRNLVTGLPQGSILAPVLYSLYINDALVATGTQLALLADGAYIYAKEKHECSVFCNLQHNLTAVKWCER